MRSLTVVAAATAALVAGCAANEARPTAELAKAHTLVEQAEKSQAQRYAAADLQRARDELRMADVADSKREYGDARMDAESAAADADLATARGSEGEAQQAAVEARQSNKVLQHEEQQQAAAQPQPQMQPQPPPQQPQSEPNPQ